MVENKNNSDNSGNKSKNKLITGFSGDNNTSESSSNRKLVGGELQCSDVVHSQADVDWQLGLLLHTVHALTYIYAFTYVCTYI